jgi:carbamoyl-phosphate synthase large subunit
MVAERHLGTIREYTRRIARALKVVGLMNVQYAIKDDTVYVLEVNPRSSRTVPYIAKATGVPMAKIAARVAAGRTLAELGLVDDLRAAGVFVKSPVFPFVRFPGVDTILGPEMKSTGEVMGLDRDFAAAFVKSQLGAGTDLPESGTVFVSVRDRDKEAMIELGCRLRAQGFELAATRGTAAALGAAGIAVTTVKKVHEGRPHIVDMIKNGEIAMLINTTEGRQAISDSYALRRAALMERLPYYTTLPGARAVVQALSRVRTGALEVAPLQSYFGASH